MTSPRFVVQINGTQRCIAGFDGYSVLSADFTHVHHARDKDNARRRLIEASVHFRVGGMQQRDHVNWLDEDLFVGDEATLRLIEGGPVDPTIPKQEHSACGLVPSHRVGSKRERLAQTGNVMPQRMSVEVNGEHLCTAGVGSGVLTVLVTYVRCNPLTRPPHSAESTEQWECGETDLHIGGLENNVHLRWRRGIVEVGDEVKVRVLGSGPIDPPIRRDKHLRMKHEDQTVFHYGRLTARKLVDDDLDFLSMMLGNPDVMRYWPKPLDRDEAEQWLRRQQQRYIDDGCGYWLVVDNETGKRIGQAGVIMTELEGRKLPMIGYMIHKPYWRQHYGIDAAWCCILHIWHRMNQPTAYTLVRPENAPSLALAQKMGMKPVRNVMHAGFDHLLLAIDQPPA